MVPDVSELEAVMRTTSAASITSTATPPGPVLTRLPIVGPDEEPVSPAYESLYARGAVPGAPVNLRTLSRLLEYALALSAWKQAGGTRWALPRPRRSAYDAPESTAPRR